MKKTMLFMFVMAVCAMAQTVESVPFRAVLSAANEVPPVNLEARGTATVWLHVVRDAAGQPVSGSVDFAVRYRFPSSVTFTGLHIHRGAAGVNGPVVMDSSLSRVEDAPAEGILRYQGQVIPANANGLAALSGVMANPAGYYVNLHTSINPAGAIRGQVERAQTLVLMTQLDASNEVPPANVDAKGTGTLMLVAGMGGDGEFTSAEVTFDVNYRGLAEGSNFTGLHIHTGVAGVNGPVVIDSSLRGPVAAAAGGAGNVRYEAEVNMSNPAAVAALYGLFARPHAYYMNLHTQANPAGVMRGQMRTTDSATFQLTMRPDNEVPPVAGLDAMAYAAFTLHTLRNNEGHVIAGVTIFDVNYRFPGEVQFTGLHIHDNVAGANGPVTLDSGLSRTNIPLSETGFGNIHRWRTQDSNVAFQSMNSVVIFPERHYMNLHTTVNAPGAVRAQLVDAHQAMPEVTAVLSGISHPDFQTLGPLGLFTVFGSDLFGVPGDSRSFEGAVPGMLNGTTVMVGNQMAAILTLGRDESFQPTDYIMAQAPAGLAAGDHPVVVTHADGRTVVAVVRVDVLAPGIYFDRGGAIAFRAADMSLIRNDNPTTAGERVALVTTGLGQTSPGLMTGEYAPGSPPATVLGPIQVSVGGVAGADVTATAWAGTAGLYRVEFTVPEGVTGTVRVTLTQIPAQGLTPRPVTSNAATITVR